MSRIEHNHHHSYTLSQTKTKGNNSLYFIKSHSKNVLSNSFCCIDSQGSKLSSNLLVVQANGLYASSQFHFKSENLNVTIPTMTLWAKPIVGRPGFISLPWPSFVLYKLPTWRLIRAAETLATFCSNHSLRIPTGSPPNTKPYKRNKFTLCKFGLLDSHSSFQKNCNFSSLSKCDQNY